MDHRIYDLDQYATNERNGTYGGKAGDKEGITIQGAYWIVKYPKSTRGMKGELLSYMTAPLSEYIGSHIYGILGVDVHQTILGIRNGKLVVACKDFCKNEGSLREVRTLKNIYNTELSKRLEESFSSTSGSHMVDLDEMLLHLKYNPVLSKIPDIKERFWELFIIDILINNNDRNNGNWGVLYENGTYRLAPVFDNGASFSKKYTEERLALLLSSDDKTNASVLNTTTIYGIDGKSISAKDIKKLEYPDLMLAEKRIIPKIQSKIPEISDFIQSIPETYGDYMVCSENRKAFYIKSMTARLDAFLIPSLELASMKIAKKHRQSGLSL